MTQTLIEEATRLAAIWNASSDQQEREDGAMLDRLLDALDTRDARIAELHDEKIALIAEKAKLIGQHDMLRAGYESAVAEVAQLEAQLAKANAMFSDLEATAAELKESRDTIWKNKCDVEADCNALRDQLAKAREALEPFAKAGAIRLVGGEDYWTEEKRIQGTDLAFHITFGDLRRARTTLAALENQDNG